MIDGETISWYYCGKCPLVGAAPPPSFAHVMAGRRVKLPFFLGLISGLVCCNFLLTWIWTGRETSPKAPFTADDEKTAVPLASKENRRQGLAVHVLIGDEEEWRMVPAIHGTWGRSTVYLAFHGPTVSLADEETLVDESLRANAHVFYRNTSLGSDGAYMSLLQEVCAQKEQFGWVAIVKPTTYVLVERLKDFLKYLDSADPVWLGRPDAADSSINCALCDDIGSVFSEAAVSKMCLNLQTCSQGAAPLANSSHLQHATIVADCLGVCCIENITTDHSHYMSQFFYSPGNLLLRQAIQMGALDGNPHVESALIISGLERPEHMLNVHFYFVMLSKSNAAKVATLVREELLQTVHRLKEAGRREESASPEANPLWLKDHHLAPPSQERTMDEVIHWESFNLGKKQAVSFSAHSPVRDMSEYELRTMMDGIVKLVPRSNSSSYLTASESVSVYRRLDPFRGIDYMVESCSREGDTCRMHHILQGFELPVIMSVEEALATLVEVKFVVSSPLMSRAFHRFIMSFESSFLVSHSEENVGLLVVVSSDGEGGDIEDGTFAVSTILHLYKKKYPHVDFRMVLTESMPTPYEVARIASKEFSPSELLFILDVHLDVAALLPQHCRLMAREKERAYAPAVFAPYNPAASHWYRMELPLVMQFQVSPKDGFWLSGAIDAVCIYNSDLISVLIAATNQTVDKWSLSEAIKVHRGLTVFQSVDPGLAYMWHEQCAEKDRRTERQVCEELDKLKTAQMPN